MHLWLASAWQFPRVGDTGSLHALRNNYVLVQMMTMQCMTWGRPQTLQFIRPVEHRYCDNKQRICFKALGAGRNESKRRHGRGQVPVLCASSAGLGNASKDRFWCDVCQVGTSKEKKWKDHLGGKRHRENVTNARNIHRVRHNDDRFLVPLPMQHRHLHSSTHLWCRSFAL